MAHGGDSVVVSHPNVSLRVEGVDMEVWDGVGFLRFERRWNGAEWKFQERWESLSRSWRNLTGSLAADTTRPVVTGEGAYLPQTEGGPSQGCWVYVDDGMVVEAGGELSAARSQPFNGKLAEGGSEEEYGAGKEVGLDYGVLCSGMIFRGAPAFETVEGIRLGNALYRGHSGQEGVYGFDYRRGLRKEAVEGLRRRSGGEMDGLLSSGRYPLDLERKKGYRWEETKGKWGSYDVQGRQLGYGDGNGNRVWLARDMEGRLRGVVSETGEVLLHLIYEGGLLKEVRDYSQGDGLASRKVQYAYDGRNRLVKITDVRGGVTEYGYDGQNQLVRIKDAEGREEEISYGNRRVKERKAADGAVTAYKFAYDEVHQQYIVEVTGPEMEGESRKERWTYNQAGQLVRKVVNGLVEEEVQRDTGLRLERRTNSRGYASRAKRDMYGQVIEIEYADGSVIKRQYGARHLELQEETDELKIKTSYQYDDKGNLTKKTEAVGTVAERITEYERNAQGRVTRLTRKGKTESNGTTTPDANWQIGYDSRGQINQTTDPEGHVRRYVYDRAGNLREATDAKGNTTRFEVDAAGNLTKTTDPLGHVQSYAYDKVGNLTTETDAKGKARQRAYDALNRLTRLTDALGGSSRMRYNAAGLPVEAEDEDGRKQEWSYDTFLRVTKEMDGLGNSTEYRYEIPDGTKTGLLGSLSTPTETRYPTFTEAQRFDRRERLTSWRLIYPTSRGEENSLGSVTYDKRGQVISETDANGKTSTYGYDALGRMTSIKDSLGNETKAAYDTRGNLIALTDANGNTYGFEYDRNDRLVKEVLPLGQTSQYRYDGNGNLTQKTSPNGERTSYSYDANDRPVEASYTKANGVLERTTTYIWDENDNLTGWTDQDHNRNETTRASLSYDDENRKTGETITYADGHSRSYGYGYSPAGNKTKLVWADGTEISYGYSQHGELKSVSIPNEGTIQVDEYKWLTPSAVSLPGGVKESRKLDGLLYLEELKVSGPGEQTLLNLSQNYGKEQELVRRSRAETANGTSNSKTETFAYDAELRLTEAQTEGWLWNDKETFTLDGAGNRIQHNGKTWRYDGNNQLIQIGEGNCGSANTVCYDYDASGNRLKKTEQGRQIHYRYDTQNRLIEVALTVNNTEQLIARYGYDPLDRRLWKEQYGDRNGQSLLQAKRTYYLYSDEGLIAEETQDITLNADKSVIATSQPNITTQYGHEPESEFSTGILFVKTKDTNGAETIAYYHHDHLQTPIQATDKQGNIVWSATYNAFGKVRLTTPNPTQEKPTLTSNLRFPGQYEDEETGLHYNYRRYYDPETGQYITSDPIGLKGGFNLYAYVGGDPLNLTDATGEILPAAGMFARCYLTCMAIGTAAGLIQNPCDVELPWGECAKECLNPFNWVKGKKFEAAACALGRNSFTGETLVQVRPEGANPEEAKAGKTELKPISEIRIEDEVLSLAEWKEKGNEAGIDQRLSYEKVVDIFTSLKEQRLVHITLETGETLTATDGHPFKTPDGWRDAILLKKGGKLLLKGGEEDSDGEAGDPTESERTVTIADVRVEHKIIQVYNLEVASAHTFFVGDDGVLVHNARCSLKTKREWEKLHGRPWPRNPLTEKIRPGGRQDGHHIIPVARGGHPTDPRNITPLTPSQHIALHRIIGYK
jgi:RHS repeat-associated protein